MPTIAMRDIIIKIMVEVLTILGIVTREMKRGRLSELMPHIFITLDSRCLERYFKKLMGNTDMDDSLERLYKLTREEARMASAELLKITHSVDGKVISVDNRVKGIEGKVQEVRSNIHDVGNRIQGVEGRVQHVRVDVQDVGNKVQDVEHRVQTIGSNISNRVQGVDHKLDQVTRSLFL